jgi:hypothetical protein
MAFDIKGPILPPEVVAKQEREETRRVEEHVTPTFTRGDEYKLDPNYHKMADLLGLKDDERLDVDIAQKLSFLRDFTGEKEEVDALLKVKQMIRDLGISSRGKELTKTLYQYARLAQEREKINKEIKVITNIKEETNNANTQG